MSALVGGPILRRVAALYVERKGVYSKLEGVELWPEDRDARRYIGTLPIVGHPPCARWGRYWSGGPSAKVRRELGDDGACDPELAAWWALAQSQAIGSRVIAALPYLSGAGLGWQAIRQRNRAGAGQTGTRWGSYLEDLERRLAHVRIVCGDYRRLLTRASLLMTHGMVEVAGIYVDPPYGVDRYAEELGAEGEAFDAEELAANLERVAEEFGSRVRIVVSGYEDSFVLGDRWARVAWKGDRGHYKGERPPEVLWSYNAAPRLQGGLFDGVA
jgi:hypothetical protein